ncbi:hypothetical protein J2Y48_000151 [Mycoplana sp. BE70]|uniref:hypothetical protein n=1 Tax=Mycoplana sp. BE70 TaxID=2817775 RepID=UPI002860CC8F|nr:hypothetical protein [Mycoplana sp. BE70]MDR6754878.1 hypothetical protein [Mycoplana sp. BE70]
MPKNARSGVSGLDVGAFLICAAFAAGLALLIAARSSSDLVFILPIDRQIDVHSAQALKVRIADLSVLDEDFGASLRKKGGEDLALSLEIDRAEKLVTVKPLSPLEGASEYTLCLSRVWQRSVFREMLEDWLPSASCTSFTTRAVAAGNHQDGAAGLIVVGTDNTYASYYEEILKAEGLNLFDSVPRERFDTGLLKHYSTVVLANSSLPSAQLASLVEWVRAGGSLVMMRPDDDLLALMCLEKDGTLLHDAYLRATPDLEAVKAFATRPLQVHGEIDRLKPRTSCEAKPVAAGGGVSEEAPRTIAALSVGASSPSLAPAIAMLRMGRGTLTAFSYDLARSIVYTRQGNPDWAGQDRDGQAPRRPNDLFYPDYLDRELIGVPQADEHQRLFANIVLSTTAMPLPRFWYLPGDRRAAIVMVGDDHATRDATATLLAKLVELSPLNCSLKGWACLRATALLTPETEMAPALVKTYHDQGFEFGVHVNTKCKNADTEEFEELLRRQVSEFRARYPFLGRQQVERFHCIVWNGWTESAELEVEAGIRFDMNYYNWPPAWLEGRPGFMTGSALPMPFVTEDGTVLDIYQAATQLVNEDQVPHPFGVRTMIERALGADQFFGAFVTHYDYSDDYADILVDEARRHNVPLISAEQLLAWVDGRNRSRFADLSWRDGVLHFSQRVARGAEDAFVHLPLHATGGQLRAVRCNGQQIAFNMQDIKGLPVATFPARAGDCTATYGGGRAS